MKNYRSHSLENKFYTNYPPKRRSTAYTLPPPPKLPYPAEKLSTCTKTPTPASKHIHTFVFSLEPPTSLLTASLSPTKLERASIKKQGLGAGGPSTERPTADPTTKKEIIATYYQKTTPRGQQTHRQGTGHRHQSTPETPQYRQRTPSLAPERGIGGFFVGGECWAENWESEPMGELVIKMWCFLLFLFYICLFIVE